MHVRVWADPRDREAVGLGVLAPRLEPILLRRAPHDLGAVVSGAVDAPLGAAVGGDEQDAPDLHRLPVPWRAEIIGGGGVLPVHRLLLGDAGRAAVAVVGGTVLIVRLVQHRHMAHQLALVRGVEIAGVHRAEGGVGRRRRDVVQISHVDKDPGVLVADALERGAVGDVAAGRRHEGEGLCRAVVRRRDEPASDSCVLAAIDRRPVEVFGVGRQAR